jgi:hypothetical protein
MTQRPSGGSPGLAVLIREGSATGPHLEDRAESALGRTRFPLHSGHGW